MEETWARLWMGRQAAGHWRCWSLTVRTFHSTLLGHFRLGCPCWRGPCLHFWARIHWCWCMIIGTFCRHFGPLFRRFELDPRYILYFLNSEQDKPQVHCLWLLWLLFLNSDLSILDLDSLLGPCYFWATIYFSRFVLWDFIYERRCFGNNCKGFWQRRYFTLTKECIVDAC